MPLVWYWDDQPHNLLDCVAPAMRVLRSHYFADIRGLLLGAVDDKARCYLRTLFTWVESSSAISGSPYHRASVLLGRQTSDALAHGLHEGVLTSRESTLFHQLYHATWLRFMD